LKKVNRTEEFLQMEPPYTVGANCVRPRETAGLPYENEKQHPPKGTHS